MPAARAKTTKTAFISAYTVMASHPGATGEVVAPCKVMVVALIQLALTMNFGIVSRSQFHLFIKRGLISTQGHGVAIDDHDERHVEWCKQPVGWC